MDNKNVQLVLQHCCGMSRLVMLRVFPPTNQTCLATNQVTAGCEALSQKVEKKFYFLRQNLQTLRILAIHIPRFTSPRQTWLPSRDVNSTDHVTHNFIQSEVSIHANCNNLICCKVGSKTCYIAFHLMEQVARFFTLVFKLTQYVLSFVNVQTSIRVLHVVFASKHDCFPLWLVLFFRHPKIWKATCSLTERISTAFFTLKSRTRRLQNSVFVSW